LLQNLQCIDFSPTCMSHIQHCLVGSSGFHVGDTGG
jgi:hypothetical protein